MNDPLQRDGELPGDVEIRTVAETELRAEDDKARRLAGYAARFAVKTKIRTWSGATFEEWLNPGAFRASLEKNDVRLLVEHDRSRLLARTSGGTLTLTEDAKGLRFEASLPDTTDGRDTYEQIRVKNFVGMSFGFLPVKYRAEYDDRGRLIRMEHDEVDLREITVTSMPAYPKTSVAVRSLLTRPAPDNQAYRLRLLKLKG